MSRIAEDGFRPLAHHFRRAPAKSKMVGLRPEAGLGPPYNSRLSRLGDMPTARRETVRELH